MFYTPLLPVRPKRRNSRMPLLDENIRAVTSFPDNQRRSLRHGGHPLRAPLRMRQFTRPCDGEAPAARRAAPVWRRPAGSGVRPSNGGRLNS